MMRVTFHAETNMACIDLVDNGESEAVRQTEPLDIDLRDGQRRLIDLDVDAFGRLAGVGPFDAEAALHSRLLAGER